MSPRGLYVVFASASVRTLIIDSSICSRYSGRARTRSQADMVLFQPRSHRRVMVMVMVTVAAAVTVMVSQLSGSGGRPSSLLPCVDIRRRNAMTQSRQGLRGDAFGSWSNKEGGADAGQNKLSSGNDPSTRAACMYSYIHLLNSSLSCTYNNNLY